MAASSAQAGWRVAIISSILPVVEQLVPFLRERGHDPVGWLLPRRPEEWPPPPWGEVTDRNAPKGLNVMLAADKWAIEPLLRGLQPELTMCWGFPWKIPAEALAVARLGSINAHPALLPRHRGPVPLAWTLRDGDANYGVTWHRMDAELDTGAILAQTTVPVADDDHSILEIAPRLQPAAFGLLPLVFERIAAGDPGDPQPTEGVTWAGHFEADYAEVDWSQPARAIHNQVRAWRLTFALSSVVGPIAELDGERVKLLQTSLVDPGSGARRVECGDGPLWVVELEPVTGG